MSRAIKPRIEHYVPPSDWGARDDGQSKRTFNYGDSFVAVLVPTSKGAAMKEIYRFTYCVGGRPSTLNLGPGGPENFDEARRQADTENAKIRQARALKTSIGERVKRIGTTQRVKKKETTPDVGFKSRNDFLIFLTHLERKLPHSQFALLIFLHITTLLDIWQLLNIKYENIHQLNEFGYIFIPINETRKEIKFKLVFRNYSRTHFLGFINMKGAIDSGKYIFDEHTKSSTSELQEMLAKELFEARIAYQININSLRNEFINEFSDCDIFDKAVLIKFFGMKYLKQNTQVSFGDKNQYSYKDNHVRWAYIFENILIEWDKACSYRPWNRWA